MRFKSTLPIVALSPFRGVAAAQDQARRRLAGDELL